MQKETPSSGREPTRFNGGLRSQGNGPNNRCQDVMREWCVCVCVCVRVCACVCAVCLASETHHLVGGVVGLELLVGGVLDVDGVVPDERGDGGVVAHHRLGALLAVELQERLHARRTRRTARTSDSVPTPHIGHLSAVPTTSVFILP